MVYQEHLEEKVKLAENLMSTYGNRLAVVSGRISAYLEMAHCKTFAYDQEQIMIKKDDLEFLRKEMEYLKNQYSHYLGEALKLYDDEK